MVTIQKLRLIGEQPSFGAFLGPLEDEILNVLCQSQSPLRVREVHAKMKKKAANTSIAVLLDRLYAKGLVTRQTATGRGGTYYLYSPAGSKNELEKKVLTAITDRLVSLFGPTAVNYFNERFNK